ncbi:MAG: hypothetical protein HZA78_02220 [Candidatus Schekmanbacteria bacterium]|nr:hypothetical protein [Candidatus Schekmanbacteria bacterium]
MKKIPSRIIDNIGLKLISLAAAIIIWFFVVIANKPELSFLVPIKFNNVPKDTELVMDEEAYEVEVRVKGNQSILSNISSRQIVVSQDLTGAKPGEGLYNINSDHVKLPHGLQVSKVTPNQVKIRLEQLMERLVPVDPVILGVPADGYELKGVVTFPDKVRITGAQSRVEDLKSVRTVSLNITGAGSSISKKLELLPLSGKLRFAATSVIDVRAIIGEKAEERRFMVPVKASPARWKALIEPGEIKVTVSGPISKIRALRAEAIKAVIDLSELKPEEVMLEVKVQLPEDLILIRKEPAAVKVISIEKSFQGETGRPTID